MGGPIEEANKQTKKDTTPVWKARMCLCRF